MDYHHYNTLGVGSIPQLLTGQPQPLSGNGLHETTTGAGPSPQQMPGPTSLLAHHPSLMFHYGVGGKAHNLPHHLIPSVSIAANIINSTCSNISSINSSISNSPLVYTKATAAGRTTATVPPLGFGSTHSPLMTTAGSARSSSPNSSFAAALRSLAKQATGPSGSEVESHLCDSSHGSSPKSVSITLSSIGGPNAIASTASPVVTIAPTNTHHAISELRKSVESGVVMPDIERLGPEDMVRGFQPYRATDLPTVTAASPSQASLRPTLPIELAHAYQPYPSLYSHHLSHQYRLEEQLYLERYSLLRPPMPPYGVGGLSALYPTASPYLSARFPPELLPSSLSALHPSSALLHERLKLEEDIRQREYELELRRERELERERERERDRERGREREREREKEKERERRQKEQHETERCKEERHKNNERVRSPLNHGVSTISTWNVARTENSVTSCALTTSNSLSKKSHVVSTQQIARLSDSRPSTKHSNENISINPSNNLSKSSVDSPLIKYESTVSNTSTKTSSKHRVPAIVRPFESNPSISSASVSYSGPVPVGIVSHTTQVSVCEEPVVVEKESGSQLCKSLQKKQHSGSECGNEMSKPFSVWQPVKLTASEPESLPFCKSQFSVENSSIPVCQLTSTTVIPMTRQSINEATGVTANNYLIAVSQACSIQSTPVLQSAPVSLSPISQSSLPVPFSNFTPFTSDSHQLAHSIVTLPSAIASTTTLSPSTLCQPVQKENSAPESQISYLPHSQPYVTHHSAVVNFASQSQSVNAGQLKSTFSQGLSNPTNVITQAPSSTKNMQLHQPFFHISQTRQSPVSPIITTSPSVQVCAATQISFQVTEVNSVTPFGTTPPPSIMKNLSLSSTLNSDVLNSLSKELEVTLSPAKKAVVVSRLDTEEQRFRELMASGMYAAEAEETLLEEARCQNKASGLLCKTGPADPFEASTEKLSFLSIFDLTTHYKADEVTLDRYERRAKVITPLVRTTSVDSNSLYGCMSATELIPKLSPGLTLSDTPKLKSTSSLLVDFSNKSKFLANLDMQPQYSAAKQRDLNRLWKLVIEDRLRRYKEGSDNPLDQKIFLALKKLLEPPPPSSSPALHDKPYHLLPITSSTFSSKTFCSPAPQTDMELNVTFSSAINATTDVAACSGYLGGPLLANSLTTNPSSTNKPNSSILKMGMKGIMEDGIFGVGSYLASEPDPLLTGLTGFDKMIDHFVKNAQAEGGLDNSALIDHIDEVRRCQMSVCQTAQIVQEQVTNLITSRSQLEAHRTALHHHLASITSILSAKNSLKNHDSQSFGGMHHYTQNSVPQTVTYAATSDSNVSNHLSGSPNNCNIPVSSMQPAVCNLNNIQSMQNSNANLHVPPFQTKLSLSASSVAIHSTPALVSSSSKTSQSATIMSWAGLQPPDDKEGIFYPQFLSAMGNKDSKSQTTTSTHTKVTSKLVPTGIPTNLSKSPISIRQHCSNKGVSSNKQHSSILHNHSTDKLNGSASHMPQENLNLLKPLQVTSCLVGSNSSSKTYNHLKIITNGGSSSNIGHPPSSSQELVHSNQLNSPNAYVFQQNNTKTNPHRSILNHNSSSKINPANKGTVGFTPYSKTSPNKVQTWLPN